jgi:hypothetical protein
MGLSNKVEDNSRCYIKAILSSQVRNVFTLTHVEEKVLDEGHWNQKWNEYYAST